MQELSWKDMSTSSKQGNLVHFAQQNHGYTRNYRPTGRRKITQAEQIWNQKLTGQFQSTSRAEVLVTFKKATSELGINDAVCRFIDLLCCWTKPIDWQENGWPLVWPSNETLCEYLGFDERKLQRIRTKAIDAGLIRMCETRDNKRWGKRRYNNPDDIVIEGCGYDLSPLAERLEEFKTLIEQAETRRKQRGILRRTCSHWKRKILGYIDYALQQGKDEQAWLSLHKETQELMRKVYRLQDISCLFETERQLQKLYETIQTEITKNTGENKEIDPHFNPVNMSPTGDKFDGLYTTTNDKIISKANTKVVLSDIAQEKKPDQSEKPSFPNKERQKTFKSMDVLNGFIVTPTLILKLAPTFRDWVMNETASWQDLEKTTPYVLQTLKINPYLWGQACVLFSRQKAIAVIAILEAKYLKGLVKNPSGLLRSFIDLYQQGKLNLDRTLFGLLSQTSKKMH